MYSWLFIVIWCFVGRCLTQSPPLEKLNIDTDAISVSGFSSGGSMAHQFHVAYSAAFMGAAVMASVPYKCSHISGDSICLYDPDNINVEGCQDQAESYAQQGLIDDPFTGLANDQIWVFNSALDTTVYPGVAARVAEFYEKYNDNTALLDTFESIHIYPTDIADNNECNYEGRPYITYCEYDVAYDLLNYIYGGMLIAPDRSDDTPLPGELRLYDQTEFVEGRDSGIGDSGFIYTPSACMGGSTACRLHIALHGCDMHRNAIGDAFATQAGYNEVAELNNIVMIYPQATSKMPENPWGCWDWWGFTGDDYVTKNGVQMKPIAMMIDRVAGTGIAPL